MSLCSTSLLVTAWFIFLQIAIAGFYDDDGSNVDPAPPPAPEPAAKPATQPPTGAPKQSATSR